MNEKMKEETYVGLLKLPQPVIPIYEDVEPALYRRIRDSLLFLETRENPKIKIKIDTRGGSVGAGLDIYDLLMSYPGGIEGIVTNSADSMGAIILQACKKRACARHASILIHHISRDRISLDDLTSKRRRDKVTRRMNDLQVRLYRILATRTGKSIAEIRRVCRKDESTNAEDALAFGLIDEIVDGELK